MAGKEIYVMWKEKEEVRKVEDVGSLVKDYFENVVPEIVRERSKEVELIYDRCGDGVFEVVEESVMITALPILIGSYNDGNAEVFRYKTEWAVVLYKCEDNHNAGFEWTVREAKIVMHGRVPRSIIKRIEEAVEELRKQIAYEKEV